MPDPERLLRTIAKATEIVRLTSGRTGRHLRITDIDDVLIAGDLHGHVGNFQSLFQRADLSRNPRRHLVFQEVVHGPFRYANGGEKSHQLLDLVAALTAQFPGRVHLLPGNHELAQFTGRSIGKGDTDYNELFLRGVRTAYGTRGDDIAIAYADFVASLPVAVTLPNGVFISHSVPSATHLPTFSLAEIERETTAGDLAPGGVIYSLVWGRDVSQGNVEAFLAKVSAAQLISGHIPLSTGFWFPSPRHLILDSLGAPAGFALVPANRPMSPEEFQNTAQLMP